MKIIDIDLSGTITDVNIIWRLIRDNLGGQLRLWVRYHGPHSRRPGQWRWIIPMDWAYHGMNRNVLCIAYDVDQLVAMKGYIYQIQYMEALRFRPLPL
jgi:hypothetical protein